MGTGALFGEVWVYVGGGSFPGNPLRLIPPSPDPYPPDSFGTNVHWFDYDGDGIDDLMLGAPRYTVGVAGEGRAYLRNSTTGGWSVIQDPTPEIDKHFAWSMDSGSLNSGINRDMIMGCENATYAGLAGAGEVLVVVYQ